MMTKLLIKILALLGFGVIADGCAKMYGPPMYAMPPTSYRGLVVNEANEPIRGIVVSTNRTSNQTNEQGEYHIYLPDAITELTFTDIDGKANGGEFETASMWIESSTSGEILSTMVLKLKENE